MTVICNFSCRFQIYRCFSFIISSLGNNYVYNYGIAAIGYFAALHDFGTKGQGCIQSLTSNILGITGNFLINLIYLCSL